MTHDVAEQVLNVPLAEIFSDSEFNCRQDLTPFDVGELAKNISENGLQQPIVIQPHDNCPKLGQKYRIVMGHRRFMAHVMLQAKTIKAIVRDGLDDQTAFTLNFVENIQRKDLNILEEAQALQRFRLWGFTQAQTSKEVGKSKGWVQTRFALLDLPLQIQQEAAAGLLTTEQVKHLASLSRDDQFELVKQIKDAKAKGQGFKIKKKQTKKLDPHKKQVRSADSVEHVKNMIYDALGPCEFTRALAWACGHISSVDFLSDVKQFADDNCKPFVIPATLIDPLFLPDRLKQNDH